MATNGTGAVATRGTASNYLQRGPSPSGLADVLELILDKGLVIDAYVRVSVIGIEILTIDLRVVIASVDTYLRFAEAVNRLDLRAVDDSKSVPDLFSSGTEDIAQHKTKGAIEGGMDAIKEKIGLGGRNRDEDDDEDADKESARSRRGRGNDER